MHRDHTKIAFLYVYVLYSSSLNFIKNLILILLYFFEQYLDRLAWGGQEEGGEKWGRGTTGLSRHVCSVGDRPEHIHDHALTTRQHLKHERERTQK